jgi:hypothetical protein
MVRFCGEPEVRWIAIERRQCTSRGHHNGAVEVLWLERTVPSVRWFRMLSEAIMSSVEQGYLLL